jgi:sulfite exporter TauE/SafE
MSSLIYVVFAVALLFSLLAMVVFFSKYSKDMNRKLNDLTALVVDRELDT